jgi:hypothetical protein
VLRSVDVDVTGLAEVVRELRKIQPELAKELPKSMRNAISPVVAEARTLLPTPSPLSNWGTWQLARQSGGDRNWTRKAYTGIVAKSNTGASKGRNRIDLLEIVQKDAAGAIYENAGRRAATTDPRGLRFIAQLNEQHGESPRYLWPAVEKNLGYINDEVQATVNRWLEQFEQRVERI